MTVIDPAGAFAQAKIITRDGEILLWPGRSRMNQDRENDVQIPFVTSISMEVGQGLSGKCSVGILASYHHGLDILEGDILKIGNILAVRFSYPAIGLSLPWYEGVTSKPDFTLSADGLTATLNGQGAAFAAGRSSGVQTWENKGYNEIIQEIARKECNGWDVQFPTRGGDNDPLFQSRPRVSQGGTPDWIFVSRLARSAGCDLSFGYSSDSGGNELRIVRRSTSLGAVPNYFFVMNGQCDFETRFPLDSISGAGEGVWLPRGNARTRSSDINPETGDREDPEVSQDDMTNEEGRNAGGHVEPGPGSTPSGANRSAAMVPDEAMQVHAPIADTSRTPGEAIRTAASDAGLFGGMVFDIGAQGLPGVWPGDTVRIGGVGIFSGNYLVGSVNHTWDGSWNMVMNVINNSQGGIHAVSELISRPWETNVNDQQPAAQPTDGEAPVTPTETE